MFHTVEENGCDSSSHSWFGSIIASLVAATTQNLETSGLSVTVAAHHCYQTKTARH